MIVCVLFVFGALVGNLPILSLPLGNVLTHSIATISTYTDTFRHINISIARKKFPPLFAEYAGILLQMKMRVSTRKVMGPSKKAFPQNLLKLQVFPYYGPDKH